MLDRGHYSIGTKKKERREKEREKEENIHFACLWIIGQCPFVC